MPQSSYEGTGRSSSCAHDWLVLTIDISLESSAKSSARSFPELKTYVEKYQDPRQADNIMRVQQELDETKIVLVSDAYASEFRIVVDLTWLMKHKTIESVLERGEKLDSLVDRSNALSFQTKAFYNRAKRVRLHPVIIALPLTPMLYSKTLAVALCRSTCLGLFAFPYITIYRW